MLQKLFYCCAAILLLSTAEAQSIKTPAPSPGQTIKQDFGIGSIELSYSRPSVKGRKIFGDLVPYGEVWRTGANGATTITFSDDVTIGGTKIQAGKYGLLTIPDKTDWTVIITKQLDVTNSSAYKKENDVVRVKVPSTMLPMPVESFTMQFINVKPTSTDLRIAWDRTAVALPITTEIDSKVMAQINTAMKNGNPPYFQAAMYYLENGKDLNQALTWFNKAIEQNPDAYFMYYQKANALAKLGRKEEARQTAQKSIELAKQQQNNDYVKLNEKLLADLK